jgi:hypothetical protein
MLSWLVSRPDGLATSSTSDGRRVGMRDVAAVRAAAEMFMQLDFRFGGGHGHKALRHYFREEVLPLLGARCSERVGKALFQAASEIAQLLAWTAYDTGNHTLANRYMIGTLRLTQVIGDRMMGARILTNMSHQANYLARHPALSVWPAHLSRAAEDRRHRGPWPCTPLTRPERAPPLRSTVVLLAR